jgi:predicted nuclease with TOPRIM domain
MATGNPQEYLALVAEVENLKRKFTALELENQRLLKNLEKVSIEKQQIHEEFTRRFQLLESAILAVQQVKVEGQGVVKEPKISLPSKFDRSRAHF